MTDWVNDYVGLPYRLNGRDRDGVDCWGLVRLVFTEQRRIDLPDWQRDGDGTHEAATAIAQGLGELTLAGAALEVAIPQPWDVVIAPYRLPHHAGVYVGGDYVLHAARARGVVCQPMVWFRREYGQSTFWRWKGAQS